VHQDGAGVVGPLLLGDQRLGQHRTAHGSTANRCCSIITGLRR
jgi:hypothetical protein